jgi:hypothetical protein
MRKTYTKLNETGSDNDHVDKSLEGKIGRSGKLEGLGPAEEEQRTRGTSQAFLV